jgi:DNA-binding transcriptional LysR family regulator
MAATVAGAGIGILPYFLAHQEPTLAPILPDFFIERRFWLQVNPDTQQLARVRATIDFIVAEMSDNSELFLSLSNRGIREKPA